MSTKPGLQLPVMAMSLVVPVAAFHNQPGCVGAFMRKHVGHPSGLISFSAMSGGELQEQAESLVHLGLHTGRDIAVIDGMDGPWEDIPYVRFVDPGEPFKPWVAFLVEEPGEAPSSASV